MKTKLCIVSLDAQRIATEGEHIYTCLNKSAQVIRRYEYQQNTYDIVFTPEGNLLFHVACGIPPVEVIN